MVDCEIVYVNFKTPLILEIKTDDNYMKLSFFMEKYRYKKILDFCPNENIKEALKTQYEYLMENF